MPDELNLIPQQPQPSIKAAFLSLNPKIVLAFFLVVIAAAMVVYLINTLVSTTAKLDAGTIALFASMVTTFILMAKSATDYQTSSSAGSDKKDDAQTAVSKALADKVPVLPALAAAAPTTDMLADAMLSNGQRAYYGTLTDDEAKKKFIAMSDAERNAVIGKPSTTAPPATK